MTDLPPVAPEVLAAALDGLPGRVRRRADALAADRASWRVGVVGAGLEVDLGEVVEIAVDAGGAITDAADVTCGCLLAPRCAHRAAVLLAAPAATPDAALPSSSSPAAPSSSGVDDPPETDPPEDDSRAPVHTGGGEPDGGAPGRHLDGGQRQVHHAVEEHLAMLLTGGALRADAELVASLTADLQGLRVHRLVVAERALTAVLQAVGAVGALATREARSDLVAAVGALAGNLHDLRRADDRGTVEEELLGRQRRTHEPIGGLSLHPVCAEPVQTGSGFAGVVVTLIDGSDRVWTLQRVTPSDLAGIGQRYGGGVDWAGLTCDTATLSRSKVVVAGATGSADGHLGGGRDVRASLAGEVEPAWERLAATDDRWQVLEGEIIGGGPATLELETSRWRIELDHLGAARRDADGLALLARARGARVRVLVRSRDGVRALLGVHPLDDAIALPARLGEYLWPGLDLVRREWFGSLHRDGHPGASSAEEVAAWPAAPSTVREVIARWLTRTVLDGGGAVRGAQAALDRDVLTLRRAGAPFAAELLTGLAEAARAGAVHAGRWQPDGTRLALAWLALARY